MPEKDWRTTWTLIASTPSCLAICTNALTLAGVRERYSAILSVFAALCAGDVVASVCRSDAGG
jgi:hypothetical protein